MTFDQAKKSRRGYFLLGCVTYVAGIPIFLVSLLKVIYNICIHRSFFIFGGIQSIVASIYNIPGIPWLWDRMSGTSLETPLASVFSPSGILGLVLIFIGRASFGNWSRLNGWIGEARELDQRQEMAATLRRTRPRQAAGSMNSDGDTILEQQVESHYSTHPNNPRTTILGAVVGAMAVIAAALLHRP